MLEKRGCRKHNVGVISRVGKKLFVNDGKQIPPQQSPNHVIVVRTNRRWVRVINKQRLHRRIVHFIQRLAQFHHVDGARWPSQRFFHQSGAFERNIVQPKASAG